MREAAGEGEGVGLALVDFGCEEIALELGDPFLRHPHDAEQCAGRGVAVAAGVAAAPVGV